MTTTQSATTRVPEGAILADLRAVLAHAAPDPDGPWLPQTFHQRAATRLGEVMLAGLLDDGTVRYRLTPDVFAYACVLRDLAAVIDETASIDLTTGPFRDARFHAASAA